MKGNVIVGQSGGPTAVINSSLAGVYKTAIDRGFNKVYGMRFGIQGLLDEKYVDLSDYIKNELDIEILKHTPSAFLGTCRYKLPAIHENQEIYVRIFEILEKLNIECFIYIGGNDSMDTIKKLSDYALLTGKPQRFLGVPKTIDNDLALTDHTP
ncbi:MAG: 6-phosphofructokinase, partial [Clostridia bacterium]|nr:6-phosphofructokinase [Clostridia bacterium]